MEQQQYAIKTLLDYGKPQYRSRSPQREMDFIEQPSQMYYNATTSSPSTNFDMRLNAVSTSNASTVSSFTMSDALNFK